MANELHQKANVVGKMLHGQIPCMRHGSFWVVEHQKSVTAFGGMAGQNVLRAVGGATVEHDDLKLGSRQILCIEVGEQIREVDSLVKDGYDHRHPGGCGSVHDLSSPPSDLMMSPVVGPMA